MPWPVPEPFQVHFCSDALDVTPRSLILHLPKPRPFASEQCFSLWPGPQSSPLRPCCKAASWALPRHMEPLSRGHCPGIVLIGKVLEGCSTHLSLWPSMPRCLTLSLCSLLAGMGLREQGHGGGMASSPRAGVLPPNWVRG